MSPETKNKGLYLSPLRHYLSLHADSSVTRSFTVANLTDQPMTLTTHLQRFSMSDLNYNYQFDTPTNDWVELVEHTIALKPYESHEVAYRVTIPKTASAGGYYYTLLAATTTATGASTSTVQAAMLLYVTVKGEATYSLRTTSSSIPWLASGPTIDYTLDVTNTGNTHYFSVISTELNGLFYKNAPNGTSQLLMPGAPRRVQASIVSPTLPGVYQLTYTIAPDQGAPVVESRYIVYIPLWSLVVLAAIVVFLGRFFQRRHTRPKTTAPSR